MLFPEDYVDQDSNSATPTPPHELKLLVLLVVFGTLFPLFLIGFGWLLTR